ncbi:hypothetical protein AAE478_010164 [Parahypoxylon ruwenzoriense]
MLVIGLEMPRRVPHAELVDNEVMESLFPDEVNRNAISLHDDNGLSQTGMITSAFPKRSLHVAEVRQG